MYIKLALDLSIQFLWHFIEETIIFLLLAIFTPTWGIMQGHKYQLRNSKVLTHFVWFFRLLDISGPRLPALLSGRRPLALAPQPSCSPKLYAISANLKQVIWYQRSIQNLVKHPQTVHYFQKTLHLRCLMMMNCFCGMVDRRKTFSLISSWDHCQRSSPSRISDTP